ncbi:TDT family transporter [Corynebacterium faecale]|uniref:TDT family transporter n=1 Tax=Corynebacterium faecale TaxID=1758466 RepID=UPI0025B403F8|nr:TDT family transporter [Corynebacterium faecale]
MSRFPLTLPTFVKNRRRYTAVLPPAGPAWAGSLMGTASTASLLGLHGFDTAAGAMLAIAIAVTVIITVGWLVYRTPGFTPQVMPAWAMVSMGVVSMGTAVITVLDEQHHPATWWFLFGCCVVGGALGLVTCLVYLRLLITGRAGSPTFSWGLPLVTPMVTATSGMRVHGWLDSINVDDGYTTFIWWLSLGAFTLSLVLAPVVFARVYYFYFGPRTHRSAQNRLEPMAAPTMWIPLGIIGQSTACAQLLTAASGQGGLGNFYGFVMCAVAVPVALLAATVHYQAALRGISYSPTWWASTFPVSTLSLGTWWLSASTGLEWLNWVSLFLLVILLFHAGVATLGGTIALMRKMVRRLRAVTGGHR